MTASVKVALTPFPVPTAVQLVLPTSGRHEGGLGAAPTLNLNQIDREAVEALIDEFAMAVMEAAGYGPAKT